MKTPYPIQKLATLLATMMILVFIDTSTLYAQYTLTGKDVVIEDGVITSCSYSFEQKDIIIPEILDGQTVISIADKPLANYGVFYDKGISSVILPSTIERIGSCAFYKNNLVSVSVPASLASIGDYAFYFNHIGEIDLSNCTALTSIGQCAFGLNSLTALDLSYCTSLVEVGISAFRANSLSSFTLPEPVIDGYVLNYWEDGSGGTHAAGEPVTDLNTSYAANMIKFSNRNFYTKNLNISESTDIDLMFNRLKDKQIEVTNVTFSNSRFIVSQSFPLTVTTGDTPFAIPVQLTSPETNLYSTAFEINFNYDGQAKSCSDSLDVAIIIDDDTELSYTGKQAIEAYHASVNINEIATLNNRGIIYRLLGKYDKAEEHFNDAVSAALEQYYGFTGIKMNQGVVQSDKKNKPAAMDNYASALTDLNGEEESSAIAPRIFYNQAWEHYHMGAFDESATKALAAINHDKSNDYLKAKGYVLLGLNDVARADTSSANVHFLNAINIDPGSCIAAIANTNIRILPEIYTDLSTSESNIFNIYPNPGNGNFTILFTDDPGESFSFKVMDMTGNCIYSEMITKKTSRHEIQIDHITPGVYLLVIQLDKSKYIRKIIMCPN